MLQRLGDFFDRFFGLGREIDARVDHHGDSAADDLCAALQGAGG